MAVSCKRAAGMLMRIIVLLMPAAPVLAQRSDSYTLKALVDSAGRNFPVLLQKQALVSSAEAGVAEARHSFLPKVNVAEALAVGTANDLSGPYLPVPGVLHAVSGGITAANNYQAATSNLTSVYGEYELVNFGLRGAKIASARAYAGVQRADLEKERYLLKWQIAKLWFEILKARYQLAVDEEDIRRYESMYTITVALTGSGINAGVDSSLAKAGLSRTRVTYNQVEGRLRGLLLQMSYLTGIGRPVPVALGGGLVTGDSPGAGLVTLGGTGTLSIPGVGLAGPVNLSGGVATTVDTGGNAAMMAAGVSHNPLAEYYAQQQQQYKSEETLIRRSYLPKIILGAGGWARGSSIQYSNDYRGLGEGLGYQRLNYTAGLGLSYDLFNGIHKKDRLAVAGQQAAAAGYALAQQELSLRNAALQAGEAMRTARNNLQELPVQMQAARDAYGQKLAQYKAGIINLVDLTNASFVLYQAQSDYVETLNGWYLAGLDKAAATGELDQFIQSVK